MDDKKLKEEFIKYFGEDKWNQEEVLADLQQIVFEVCENWLGIEPIPVLFGEHIGTDEARLDIKEQIIWLNLKNQGDWVELLNGVLHELEHLYQLIYASSMDTPKAKRWKKELNNYIGSENPLGNLLQEIEIDASAFAQVVMSTEFGIEYRHEDLIIQELIDSYIKTKKILSDD